MFDVETIVIGAGAVGLAVARALALAGQEVLVIEKHGHIGSETSSRNSEVIHAGIYYPTGSLKARFCVEGKKRLYDFCKSHNVPHNRIGKIIVAANEAQESVLDGISKQASRNGVNDLKYLDARDIASVEPDLAGVRALFSPSTGIVDSHGFMLALQGDAEEHGMQIAYQTVVTNISAISGSGYAITTLGDETFEITCQHLVVCGGLHTSDLLRKSDLALKDHIPETRFAKGNYFRFSGRVPFSHLIYPVPEPGGLGVHLTLDMGGQARFGPDVEWIDHIDYEVDERRSEKFYAAIRTYWPDLPDNSLLPDYAGIRPKLSGPSDAAADFLILDADAHGQTGLVALVGIESPGLTASLAIAEHVRSLLEREIMARFPAISALQRFTSAVKEPDIRSKLEVALSVSKRGELNQGGIFSRAKSGSEKPFVLLA